MRVKKTQGWGPVGPPLARIGLKLFFFVNYKNIVHTFLKVFLKITMFIGSGIPVTRNLVSGCTVNFIFYPIYFIFGRQLSFYICTTVGENIIADTKIRNNYGAIQSFIFHSFLMASYFDGLFSIAPHLVIALPTLR